MFGKKMNKMYLNIFTGTIKHGFVSFMKKFLSYYFLNQNILFNEIDAKTSVNYALGFTIKMFSFRQNH